jgi:hypothetical protein
MRININEKQGLLEIYKFRAELVDSTIRWQIVHNREKTSWDKSCIVLKFVIKGK